MADHNYGELAGKTFATLIVLAFLTLATTGFLTANHHLTTQATTYTQAATLIQNGKLTHLTATAQILTNPTDPLLNITANAVCLHRNVLYYQWREEEAPNRSGSNTSGTRYVYAKRWVRQPIDSTRFRLRARPGERDNTTLAPIKPSLFPAPRVELAGYELTDPIKKAFPNPKPLDLHLSNEQLSEIAKRVLGETERAKLVHAVDGNGIYFGLDPSHPRIGDVQVSLNAALPGKVSVIGLIRDGAIDEFVADNGGRLALVHEGEASSAQMLGGLSLVNSLGWWGIRLGLVIAYWLLLLFLGVVHEWGGTGMLSAGLALGCLAMAAAWYHGGHADWQGFLYFPIAAAAAGMWMSKRRRRREALSLPSHE